MTCRRLLLLRGVNVGRGKRIPMADLRELLTRLGCDQVTTHLNSGNAVVTTSVEDPLELARCVEQALTGRFGLQVAVIVRTADEMAAVVAANPLAHPDRDPSRLLVTFLATPPADPGVFWSLDHDDLLPEEHHLHGRELFGWFPNGLAEPRMSLPQWERLLGTVATARNWRTTLRLAEQVLAG